MTKTNLERSLSYCLMALLFLLPWQTIWLTKERFLNGVKWEYGTLGVYATEILLWTCAILFIFWYWPRAKLRVTSYPASGRDPAHGGGGLRVTKDRLFVFACLLFTLYSLLSSLWSSDRDLAFQHTLRVMEAFILFFMLLLGPITWRAAAGWFVAGAAAQSILGIWQFLSQSTIAVKWLGLAAHPAWEAGTAVVASSEIGRWLRAYGAFPHPNVFGGYLVVGLILTTLLYKTCTTNRTNRLTFCILHFPPWAGPRPLAVAAFCIQTAALFFTFSRSAWLAWAIWMAGWLIWHKTDKAWAGSKWSIVNFQLSIFVILAIIFLPLVQTRISGTATNELTSTADRLSGFGEAGQLFRLSPWLGVGPGHYTVAAHALNPNRPGWEYQPVHNVPLLMLVELGVIGVTLFGAVIISATSNQGSRIRDPVFLISLFSFLPIFLLDHYLYSTYLGLIISATYLALVSRNNNSTP